MAVRAALMAVVCVGAALAVAAQREMAISAIQGSSNMSPVMGERVRAQGIVTALHRTGFFIQTPDDQTDDDPLTSEGVFVFTRTAPPKEAAIGNLVSVTGTVEEYRPRNEPNTLPLTEISMQAGRDSVKVISGGNPLPKPVELTPGHFESNKIDQLERYEGMRVYVAAMTVVAPTGGRVDIATSRSTSNGVFFGVLKGIPRPFREPGLDIFDIVFLKDTEKDALQKNFPNLPIFDGNPQKIRVESMGQTGGTAIEAAANTEIADLTGVMHYAFRNFTLLVDADSKHKQSSTIKPVPMPEPKAGQISVAGINLENFFDDHDDPKIKEPVVTKEGFAGRLKKISLAFRDVLTLPDVIGVAEAENLAGLKRLAEAINRDTVSAGKPDPQYEAFLEDGNDGRGIDNGFLIKTSKLRVIEVKQFGKDEKYKHPRTGESVHLNDRPPLMIRVVTRNTGGDFGLTVFANHLKSFLGYNDPNQRDNVRMKKRLQAEYLAKIVQERQKADPKERIIVLGDMNAYQFNDGVLDLLGIIAGKPAAKDAVFNFSPDIVEPDLINLVDVIDASQRYSYTYDGNAQVIDHFLISVTLRDHISGFGYARVNADHPDSYRNDTNRPERFSDHDAAVAYFSMTPVR